MGIRNPIEELRELKDMRRNDELQNAQVRRQNVVLSVVSHIIVFALGMLVATVLTGS
jgi:hypothetical protein